MQTVLDNAVRTDVLPSRVENRFNPHFPQRTFGEMSMGFLGTMLLLAGLLPAIGAAVHFPRIMQVMNEEHYPYTGPPSALLRVVMGAGAWVLLLISATLLMLARKRLGAAHVVRAMLAVIAFGGACAIIYAAFGGQNGLEEVLTDNGWYNGIQRRNASYVLHQYVEQMKTGLLLVAGLVAALGVLMLAWPPSRQVSQGGAS